MYRENETTVKYIDVLVQDCSNSIALAMELLQSCAKPSIYSTPQKDHKTLKICTRLTEELSPT